MRIFLTLAFLFSAITWADTTEENRYVVFGIGQSQSLAKAEAVARADKIAKQSGKKFEVTGESYSKFTGGTIWKCRLEVAFYNFVEELATDTFPIAAMGEDKETAIANALEKLENINSKKGNNYVIVEQTCELLDTGLWLCILRVKAQKDFFDNATEHRKFRVPGFAETKREAQHKAQQRLRKIAEKTGKKYNVAKEAFFKLEDGEFWMCLLTVECNSKDPQQEFRIPAMGSSAEEAKSNAAEKFKKLKEKAKSELEVVQILVKKLQDEQYLCVLTVRKLD